MANQIPAPFAGQAASQTHHIQVLIDSGSTHNFLQCRLAEFLQLPVQPTTPFDVLVGNGATMECRSTCPAIPLDLHQHLFLVDAYIIPLQGADLVLEIQWLQQLGDISTNFRSLTMTFTLDNQWITLQGTKHIPVHPIQYNQLVKLSSQQAISSCFQLQTDMPTPDTSAEAIPPALQPLLSSFANLFQKPSTMPPLRTADHRIPLQANTDPISIRPYRYPHYQKSTIETLVYEMLEKGLIRPSTSAFSPLSSSRNEMAHGGSA